VTDVRRGESLFDLDLTAEVCPKPFPPFTSLYHSSLILQSCVDEGVRVDGSNLSGVSAVCTWEDKEGHSASGGLMPAVHGMAESLPAAVELLRTISLEQVHLKFNLEAARLLPLAIR